MSDWRRAGKRTYFGSQFGGIDGDGVVLFIHHKLPVLNDDIFHGEVQMGTLHIDMHPVPEQDAKSPHHSHQIVDCRSGSWSK